MRPDEGVARLRALGFSEADAATLFAHFDDAERRGKPSHGHSRIEWLETFDELRPEARPVKLSSTPALDRWEGSGALGYLTLAAICADLLAERPSPVRVVTAANCFPTGMLGHWVRRLADAGLVALLTATSPPRLPHPDGSEPLVGTNPLAIGIPSAGGRPIVVDVSMGKATYGDVLRGAATSDDLVPFGGEQAHKAFALALGLELLVDSFAEGYGALLVAIEPETRAVADAFRARAEGLRLPGDS